MKKTVRSVFMLLSLAFAGGLAAGLFSLHQPANPAVQAAQSTKPRPTLRVITLGGSIARGWMDTGWQNWKKGWFGGYLVRGFKAFSLENDAHYEIINHTIVGANSTQMATMYKGDYGKWLAQDKPQIVVLSWGLLNDALPKTPLAAFDRYVRDEIIQGLDAHAVVFVISPPVSEASLTTYKTAFRHYLNSEIALVRQLHNPNVYMFNLYDPMHAYMDAHHISVKSVAGNTWHPNSKGHAIAGQILANELEQKFGKQPVRYQ